MIFIVTFEDVFGCQSTSWKFYSELTDLLGIVGNGDKVV